MANISKAIKKDLKNTDKKEKIIYMSRCMGCFQEWVYFKTRPYSKCALCGCNINSMEAK